MVRLRAADKLRDFRIEVLAHCFKVKNYTRVPTRPRSGPTMVQAPENSLRSTRVLTPPTETARSNTVLSGSTGPTNTHAAILHTVAQSTQSRDSSDTLLSRDTRAGPLDAGNAHIHTRTHRSPHVDCTLIVR